MTGSSPGNPGADRSGDRTARVPLPDGRVLAFRGEPVVGFNLFEAQRHARRGARTREQALADLYCRDDGIWEVSDPSKELDLLSDLAAAVLLAHAALEALVNHVIDELEPDATVDVEPMKRALSMPEKLRVVAPALADGPLGDKLARLSRLHDGLVGARGAEDPDVLGLLLRGDADTCADDAIEVVRALRPELLPSVLL